MCAGLADSAFNFINFKECSSDDQIEIVGNSSVDNIQFSKGINFFTLLPTEILHHIFMQFDTKSRINLREVCATWGSPLADENDRKHLFYSIIDVRTILEFQHEIGEEKKYKQLSDLQRDYRNLRTVVNLVGGWEKYRNLPEIDLMEAPFEERISNLYVYEFNQIIYPSELSGPMTRVKDVFGIIFRHYNTITGMNHIELGYIATRPKVQFCEWLFSFGHNFPAIIMNRDNKAYKIDPALENEMNDLIVKPVQVVRELFSRPGISNKANPEDAPPTYTHFEMKRFNDSEYHNEKIILCKDKS